MESKKKETKIINLNLTMFYKVNLYGKLHHRTFKLKDNIYFLIINYLSFTQASCET